ncbi:MAG: HD domain-containing protein [Candidatus Aenigmatarchaeota archaeon]
MKNLEHYKNMVKDVYFEVIEPGGSKGFRYYHSLRVFRYCKKILKYDEIDNDKIDRDALLISALFHDIGGSKSIENGIMRANRSQVEDYEENHESRSARFVEENLEGLSDGLKEKVENIVSEHHSEDPDNYETLILQDADNLDELGYLTIFRTFTYIGFKEQTFDEMIDYYMQAEENNKLEEILKRFNFKSTRKVAEQRISKAKKFMEELMKEHEGGDLV